VKDKNRFFNAATDGSTLTLDMFDVIGADYYGGGITEQTVSDALKSSNASSVTLNINSPGGDAFSGVAIRNVLVQSGKTISVNVVGLAASAASVIAMAGDSICMHAGSVMMIHPAQSFEMGSADDMRKMADTLDTVTGSIADVYVAKTGLKKSKVLDMMNAETWMASQEAVDQGFATCVNAEKSAVTNSYDLKAFRNAPAELKIVNATEEKPVDEPKTEAPVEAALEAAAEDQVDLIGLYTRQLVINRQRSE
jgi:ATP-dependent protease ClpP protease subunit